MPGKTSNIRWKVGRDFPGRNDLLRDFPGLAREQVSAAATEAGPRVYGFATTRMAPSAASIPIWMQSVGMGGGLLMDVIGVHAPMQLTPTPCWRSVRGIGPRTLPPLPLRKALRAVSVLQSEVFLSSSLNNLFRPNSG